MTEIAKTHDLTGWTCAFMGLSLDSYGGWGDGGGMKCSRDSDAYTDKVGADGSVVRSPTNDDRVMVTLTFLQTASINSALSSIYSADVSQRLLGLGGLSGPILIRDRNGLTEISGLQAWIVGPPKELTVEREVANLEWQIRIANAVTFLGGN
jgi:hypothetical protein